MKTTFLVGVSAFAILLVAGGAWATNITIADTIGDGTASGWWRGVNVPDPAHVATVNEDNEVEPRFTATQAWDLEAVLFDQSSKTLTLVGGWDFRDNPDGYASGDLFFATRLPNYGATIGPITTIVNPIIAETFNYTSVLDIDWETMRATSATTANFVVRALNQNTSLEVAVYGNSGLNVGSNPYRWFSTPSPDGDVRGSGTATYNVYASDAALVAAHPDAAGITGGTHYTMTFSNLSVGGIVKPGDLWTHFTQGCGNDDLMAFTDVEVPEPLSMVMLGCLGAGMIGARKLRKSRKPAK